MGQKSGIQEGGDARNVEIWISGEQATKKRQIEDLHKEEKRRFNLIQHT